MKNYLLNIIRKAVGTIRLQESIIKYQSSVSDYHFEDRRFQLIEHILHDTRSGVTSERYTDHDIVVSLTTYGKRIHDVAFTIESIMQQSMKPNRIVLWLDYCFQNQRLPQSLLNQQDRGLEIAYCEDIRSYTKLIPQLRQTPNDAIITVDDDLLYDYDLLEHLIIAHLYAPNKIHCCRVHKMIMGSDGELLPYNDWEWQCPELGDNIMYFLTGVGGVLYPPYCFDEEVFNKDVFLNICKYADDVWFTAMALKKGTLINKVYTRNSLGEDYILNKAVQDTGLGVTNVLHNRNDSQIKAVFSKYSLYQKMR